MLVWMKVVVVMRAASSMQIKVCGATWAEVQGCYRCDVQAGSIWNRYGRLWKRRGCG